MRGRPQTILPLDQRLDGEQRRFFKKIHEKHHEALCRFLRRFGLSAHDVEDLAQDVYLRVVAQNEPGKLEAAPRSYLYKVATNLYRDRLRRERRRPTQQPVAYDAEEAISMQPSPELCVQSRQSLEIVREALRELSPQRRRILLLHRLHNLTCKEIAADLDVSLRTVERHLNEALAYCQSKLERAQ